MIVSFYSYKGGVGRSQLCANVAAYLCHRRDKKVLLWDWDFEAPGLHYFFGKTNDHINADGTIEVLLQFTKMMRTQDEVTEADFSFFQKESFIPLVDEKETGGKGKIDILPAGNYNNKFVYNVSSFDWYEFYELLDGKVYTEALKKWIQEQGYDYILIDSRTGIHDYLGICNLQLPDANVAVMAANQQNIDGCKRIIDQILNSEYTKKGFRKSFVFPILSRINSNHPKFDDWADKFTDTFHQIMPSLDSEIDKSFSKEVFKDFYLDKTLLADEPQFSAGENVLIKDKRHAIPRNSFMSKFANIAEYLLRIDKHNNIEIAKQIDKESWLSYAEIAVQNEQNEKAAIFYEKAGNYEKSVEYGGTSHSYLMLGKNISAKGDTEKAIAYYKRSIEIDPNNYEAFFMLGNANFELDNYKKSIEYYKNTIKIKPDYYWATGNIGLAYFNIEKFNKAIEYYKTAIKIKPDYIWAILNLGNTYFKLSKYDEAAKQYQKIINIEPNNKDALCNLGMAYANLKEYDKSLKQFNHVLSIESEHLNAFQGIATTYFLMDNYNKAIEYYQRAMNLEPSNHEILSFLGASYFKLGNISKSTKFYIKAIGLKHDYAECYGALGFNLLVSGEIKIAKEKLIKAIELGCHDIGYMNLGHIYLVEDDENKALECYRKSISSWKNESDFWEGMKDDYQYLEQYGLSKEEYEEVIKKIKNTQPTPPSYQPTNTK